MPSSPLLRLPPARRRPARRARGGGRRARVRGPLRPPPSGAARLLPAHARLPSRRPRTPCSRRSCARIARWPRAGRPRTCGPGCTRSRATAASRCCPPGALSPTAMSSSRSTGGLGDQVQARADLRAVVADVERLPHEQRAALVLAELADLSHEQIAEVIGVRPGKVKALIHQARSTLIAERDARETPCAAIREQLATARGGMLRRGPLRRHLRACEGCRAYRDAVGEQRRALALALPVTPSLGPQGGHPRRGVRDRRGRRRGGRRGHRLGGRDSPRSSPAGALLVGGGATGGAAIVNRADPAPRPARVAAKASPPLPAAAGMPAALRTSVGSGVQAGRRISRTVRRHVRAKRAETPALAAAPKPATAGRGSRRPRLKPLKPPKHVKAAIARPPKHVKAAKPAKPVQVAKPAKPPKAAKPPKPWSSRRSRPSPRSRRSPCRSRSRRSRPSSRSRRSPCRSRSRRSRRSRPRPRSRRSRSTARSRPSRRSRRSPSGPRSRRRPSRPGSRLSPSRPQPARP